VRPTTGAHRGGLRDQRGQPGGGRRLAAVRLGAQDADQIPQLVQRLAAVRAQILGGLPGGGVGGGHPQRPGLQHHQADPVRHHVVHLTGQPGAFLRPGLLGQQVTLPLGPLRPLGECLHQPPPGLEVQPQQRPHNGFDWKSLGILLAWGAAGGLIAVRRFRWDSRVR
jgi:hypothetical protein